MATQFRGEAHVGFFSNTSTHCTRLQSLCCCRKRGAVACIAKHATEDGSLFSELNKGWAEKTSNERETLTAYLPSSTLPTLWSPVLLLAAMRVCVCVCEGRVGGRLSHGPPANSAHARRNAPWHTHKHRRGSPAALFRQGSGNVGRDITGRADGQEGFVNSTTAHATAAIPVPCEPLCVFSFMMKKQPWRMTGSNMGSRAVPRQVLHKQPNEVYGMVKMLHCEISDVSNDFFTFLCSAAR